MGSQKIYLDRGFSIFITYYMSTITKGIEAHIKTPSFLETLDNAISNIFSSVKTGNDFDKPINSTFQQILDNPSNRKIFDEAVQELKTDPNISSKEITLVDGRKVLLSVRG